MHKKTIRSSVIVLGIVLLFGNAGHSYSQTSNVKLQYENGKLYTQIGAKRYLIGEAAAGGPSNANAMLDPRRQNVYYVKNTGCGFENEGTTLFVSDVRGQGSFPVLARCGILTPARFLNSGGRSYLLIKDENGATAYGTSFWLLDVNANRFEVHVEGEITARSNGKFSYGFYDESETLKPQGTVTIQTLLKRDRPLRLLPRQPTRALTVNNNTKLVFTDSYCSPISDEEFQTIKGAGSQLLIAGECPNGDYEVYFQGWRGKVAKQDLKPLLSNQFTRGPKEPVKAP